MTDKGPGTTERYASVWDTLEATPGAAGTCGSAPL